MMNMAPTVSGAGFEKTEKAISAGKSPDTSRMANRESAVTSGDSFSQAKLANASANRANTKKISQVIINRCLIG